MISNDYTTHTPGLTYLNIHQFRISRTSVFRNIFKAYIIGLAEQVETIACLWCQFANSLPVTCSINTFYIDKTCMERLSTDAYDFIHFANYISDTTEYEFIRAVHIYVEGNTVIHIPYSHNIFTLVRKDRGSPYLTV